MARLLCLETTNPSSTWLLSPTPNYTNALSYHRTREAIAAGITRFHHIVGTTNPADILSKHWGHSSIWETLHPLLFWRGDPKATPTP